MSNLLTTFKKLRPTPQKLDAWFKASRNVLFIGTHGIGKSETVLACFDRNCTGKYAYFSGATLDPWTDIIGIPRSIERDGETKLEYVRPAHMNSELEAIFVDEFNRMNKAGKNALMELIQFKSINGYKFPNLKIVWAAVNPPNTDTSLNEEDFYHVDQIDPAQLDRFHVIIQLESNPDKEYFKQKYGHQGESAVDWWNTLQGQSKSVSPRRLEMMIQFYNDKGDISECVPEKVNVAELKKTLGLDIDSIKFSKLMDKPTEEAVKEFFVDLPKWLKYKKQILKSGNMVMYSALLGLQNEMFADAISSSPAFQETMIKKAAQDTKVKEKFVEVFPDPSWDIRQQIESVNKSQPTATFSSLNGYKELVAELIKEPTLTFLATNETIFNTQLVGEIFAEISLIKATVYLEKTLNILQGAMSAILTEISLEERIGLDKFLLGLINHISKPDLKKIVEKETLFKMSFAILVKDSEDKSLELHNSLKLSEILK